MNFKNRNLIFVFSLYLVCILIGSYFFINNFSKSAEYVTSEVDIQPIGEILRDTIIEQPLPDLNQVNDIQIQLATYAKEITSSIEITLIEDGENIFSTQINGREVNDNEYLCIDVPDINIKEHGNLILRIKGLDGTENNALTIWTSKAEEKEDGYEINAVNTDRVLNIAINKTVLPSRYLIGAIIFFILAGLIYISEKLMQQDISLNFIIIYTAVSMCLIFFSPIGQTPDEYMHLYRSYGLSEGQIFAEYLGDGYSKGVLLPIEINNLEAEGIDGEYKPIYSMQENIPIDKYIQKMEVKVSNKREYYVINNTLVYFPTAYLPQTIGIFLGRIFNLNLLGIITLGRVVNSLVYAVFAFASIRIVEKRYQMIMLFISLFPMTIYLSNSLSTDAFINAITFLYIGLCFKKIEYFKNGFFYKSLLYFLGILLVLGKFVYLPIVLLHWIKEERDSKSIKIAILYDVILCSIIVAWNLFVILKVSNIAGHNIEIIPFKQLYYILMSPLDYIKVLVDTIYTNVTLLVNQLTILGWLTHSISQLFPFTMLFMFIYTFVEIQEDVIIYKVKKVNQILIGVIIIFTIGFIFTALYLTWTPVGGKEILGVQGRYFIPIIPLIMIWMKDFLSSVKLIVKNSSIKLSLFLFLLLIYMCIYIIFNFWTVIRF